MEGVREEGVDNFGKLCIDIFHVSNHLEQFDGMLFLTNLLPLIILTDRVPDPRVSRKINLFEM